MNEYDLDILKLKNQGYCCSQIVLHMALDIQGTRNPGLMRAMTGLCRGYSSELGPCGALTGALCLLAYYAGKGRADEEADERLPLMLSELVHWFEKDATARFGGSNCAQIVSDFKPDLAICGGLISGCYGQALTMMVENGIDPAGLAHD
jgi:hypothetical protein